MHSSMYAYERDPGRIDGLQVFAVPEGYEPVFGAMYNVGMAVDVSYPFVCTKVVAKHVSDRQDGQEAGNYFAKVVVRRVEYEVTGFVVGGYFAGKAAADAPAIYDNMVLGVIFQEGFVYELHVGQHFFLTAFAGAFTKAPVVDHHHIVIVPVEVAGIFGPALDAAGIAVEVKNKSLGLLAVEVQPVDAYAGRYIKE